MKDLIEQVAVVTGGGGGIGSAICRRLAAAGAQVVITYSSDQAKARAVANSLPGSNHLIIRCPVEEGAAQAALAETISEKYGRVDILVNNAGVTSPVAHADLDGLDDDTIDRIFRVNWRGAFASIRALQPLLAGGEGGVIINISSIAGRTGVGSNVAYCASKAAMDSMTRSLARALAPQIRVLSVSPRLGQRRICATDATRAVGRAGRTDTAPAYCRSGRCGGGGLCGGGPSAL